MTDDDLLQQVVVMVRKVLSRPTLYFPTAYDAENCITTMLAFAVALERGDTLEESLQRTWNGVRELTKDIPAEFESAKYLCEEQILPERRASNQMLMKRGAELCASLLKNWRPEEFVPPKEHGIPWNQHQIRDNMQE
ncbi:MAG TPA: hypothetical protein DD670_05175 [Planctomycetaceae bacterium]|nr:hypothetical protein [Planctomycetaceae bacterium]